jgi:biotin carboxyl carrier protein
MRCALVSCWIAFGLTGCYAVSTPESEGKASSQATAAIKNEAEAPVIMGPAARANLGLRSAPLKVETYWRVIELPGRIVDRPGMSDRGVVAPVAAVVTAIHAFPGDTVRPEAPLFTIRLVSDSLHSSQLELYKATREMEIVQRQKQRLGALAKSGAVSESRIIELDNQLDLLQATVDAYQQDLAAHGLPADRIDAVAKGAFATEMVVRAPPLPTLEPAAGTEEESTIPFHFELQTLNVELGEQVAAGEVLCHLADHRQLLIEGHGFADDMPLVQLAARDRRPIVVSLNEPTGGQWPPFEGALNIDHLANSIDSVSRTFSFYLTLRNEWQVYVASDTPRLLWRFRPGGQVRLRVPVEQLENVYVVPRGAVVREGPEAWVFRQNGDLFDRRPVQVLHEDRLFTVLAATGPLQPGMFIAQSGAAALQRVRKSQSASGLPAGVHVHADGSVHGAH